MDLVTRLSFLFGTEAAVERRRQLVLLREKILTAITNGSHRVICSGSLGEGLAYPASDDDVMVIPNFILWRVYESFEEAAQHRAHCMRPSAYSPGFCLLECTAVPRVFFPSKLYRSKLLQRSRDIDKYGVTIDFEEHGPCISGVDGQNEYDIARPLPCTTWPSIANEWITRRRRYGWPSRDLMDAIARGGCHFVPIGNPTSPKCDLEWRVSFSLAERSLVHSFNHVQFLVYSLLKLVLKRVFEVRIPNVLCSYFIKTVMFYTIENTNPTLWVNDKIEECYQKCYLWLYHFINEMNCPNYFIPDNNMMKRKVNTDNRVTLLSILGELMSHNIIHAIHLCGESDVLSLKMSKGDVEMGHDFGFLFSSLLDNFLLDIRGGPFSPAQKFLLPAVSCYRSLPRNIDSSFLILMVMRIFTQVGLERIRTSTEERENNKSRYQMLQFGQNMLRKGCNADISSGRLQLANFMFMTGRVSHSLTITNIVLSKCPPYVMPRTLCRAVIDRAAEVMYREILVNKGYSFLKRVRKGWALYVHFDPMNAGLSPFPISMLLIITNFVICIQAFVYLYFLRGLCFYRTRDTDSMNTSVSLLEYSVGNIPLHFLGDIFCGRFLLGYMRMLQQDFASSFRCLKSAYLMKNALFKRSGVDHSKHADACLILLGCVFNRVIKFRYCEILYSRVG